ncbi:MAG TPA: hypothetical protein VEJ46_12050 [Candidatus Acidoferrum sp.]|nr:hypothetical protein [Candidatus Acidoferrum sp.]
MNRWLAVVFALSLSAYYSPTKAQTGNKEPAKPKMSPVRLLPNFKFRLVRGIDTWGATIWNNNGVKVELNQGLHVGVATDLVDRSDVVWHEEQVVNGHKVACVYTKTHHLIVSFPELFANFDGGVRDQRDLTEMLLIVLTYDPNFPYPADPEY